MNKLIMITAMLFVFFNGDAKPKQAKHINRVILTHKIIAHRQVELLPKSQYHLQLAESVSVISCRHVPWRITYDLGILALPQRNINKIANTVAGVVSID